MLEKLDARKRAILVTEINFKLEEARSFESEA